MSYVACAGQIHMAGIGYAPLPPQLSQFLADAVGYMTNQPAQQLNASNCSNPTFSGSLGAGASPPPLPPIGNAPGGSGVGAASGSSSRSGTSAGGTNAANGTGSGNGSGAAGSSNTQSQEASNLKEAAPAALGGGQLPTSPLLPLLALLVLVAAPVVVLSVKQKRQTKPVKPDDSIAL
jgi:phosphate transport system substrate-binding protein